LLEKARACWGYRPTTLGADKGFFAKAFIESLLTRKIAPHIAVDPRGRQPAHARVRMRVRSLGYQLSQRCRKTIEELFGEGRTGMASAASAGGASTAFAKRAT
jgi:hypothetical protein